MIDGNQLIYNPIQLTASLLQAKNKYWVWGRGCGKSFSIGEEVDENIRYMPRGITSVTQQTYGQALTKTLPSTFKALENRGYHRYNEKTKRGSYVIGRKPPRDWRTPYEHILSHEYAISFSNGHMIYLLSQEASARGPNVDHNITDEALTINKEKFDMESAPTNRGNETIFGKHSPNPVAKHHGNTFASSMPYTSDQKWMLLAASYYEEERGVNLIEEWNKMVRMQLNLIEAVNRGDTIDFKETWNRMQRTRQKITPFVSKDSTLFLLGSVFDNIGNLGMNYITNMYKIMDKLTFLVEILNYVIDKIEGCYYDIDDDVHLYRGADNSDYIRGLAENNDWDFKALEEAQDSRNDADCIASQPLEITMDWGANTSFLEVAQCSNYDWVNRCQSPFLYDNNINEFFAKREEATNTVVEELVKKFCVYYRYHLNKRVILYRDRHGDSRTAGNKKSYNEMAIDMLIKEGWAVEQKTHAGQEPPQNDKYLLWQVILKEGDQRAPRKRFNANKCKYTLISMNNTKVREDSQGRFSKDKRSERNRSILPEEATHFGDCVDKRIWTKYSSLLSHRTFVDITDRHHNR